MEMDGREGEEKRGRKEKEKGEVPFPPCTQMLSLAVLAVLEISATELNFAFIFVTNFDFEELS